MLTNNYSNIEETHVKNVYEEIAYHFSDTRVYKWSWIISFLDSLNSDSLVYELGCGNGRNMNYDKKNLTFIGLDNCENFVKICKNKNLNVVNGNIINIPFKKNTADAIICIAVFHHLSNQNNIEIIGLNYKDNSESAKNFLKELGSPYKIILSDNDGTIAIEWGAYGVPETFLIYNKKIIKKIIGPLSRNSLLEIKKMTE